MNTLYHDAESLNSIRRTCFAPAAKWTPPTASEIRIVLEVAGLSQTALGKLIKVSDRTVRRWGDGTTEIAYSAWCVLCMEAGLPKFWN